MYLLAKFSDHRSYKNGDGNSYIKSYRDALQKAELTALIRHIARFLISGIPIYNSEFPYTAGRKTTTTRKEHRQLQSVLRVTQTQ